jgi:hypothetical protein
MKIFVPSSGPVSDSVQNCIESSLGYSYTIQSGFRLSALLNKEFIENFVKAGEVTVCTAVERSCVGAEHENWVSVVATGRIEKRNRIRKNPKVLAGSESEKKFSFGNERNWIQILL